MQQKLQRGEMKEAFFATTLEPEQAGPSHFAIANMIRRLSTEEEEGTIILDVQAFMQVRSNDYSCLLYTSHRTRPMTEIFAHDAM